MIRNKPANFIIHRIARRNGQSVTWPTCMEMMAEYDTIIVRENGHLQIGKNILKTQEHGFKGYHIHIKLEYDYSVVIFKDHILILWTTGEIEYLPWIPGMIALSWLDERRFKLHRAYRPAKWYQDNISMVLPHGKLMGD